MGVAATTTGPTMVAIQASLALLSVKLGRIAERQDKMLADLKKTTAALMPIPTTTPMFAPNGVLEQPAVKPSSPSLLSAGQVVGAGAPPAKAIPAPFTPTKCSTQSPAHYIDSSDAELVFPASATTHLPATTSSGAGNYTLQGVGCSGMNTPAGCSTHVRTWLRDVSGARARDVDSDMSAEVLTHVGGLSLFQELELDYVQEVLNDTPLKDVMWYEELADCVISHIGGSSLFLEQIMDTHHEHEGEIDKPTPWEHGLGGVGLVLSLLLSEKDMPQQLLLRVMQQQDQIIATLSVPWDRGKYEFPLHDLNWQVTNAGKGTIPALLCEWGTLQWSGMMQQRSRKHVAKTTDIMVLGSLGRDDLKKLCGKSFPEWISFQQYEHVKWNKTFELNVEDKETQSIIFNVYDEDNLPQDKRLGVAKQVVNNIQPETPSEISLQRGITLISNNSKDYGYEFYFSQQSKFHYAKSELLMWPSKYLLMPWDPGDMHNKVSRGCSIQSIGAVDLHIPWDPGIVTIHNAFVLYVSRLNYKWSCMVRTLHAIAWGQAMFFGGGIVMPGTLRDLGLGIMGHGLVLMGWQYRWMATKGEAAPGEGHGRRKLKSELLCPCSSLRPRPLRWPLSTSGVLLRWPLSTSGVILFLTLR